jgi:hypothetical protein
LAPPPSEQTAPLRLAVIATPRSGNAWLSHLLTSVYALEGRGVASASDIPWDALPRSVVLNFHALREPSIERRLAGLGFETVVTARHPLDTLISILQLARHEPATNDWLDGAGGDERDILGATPTSDAFLRYATGPRSRALLEVSRSWRGHGGPSTRYEDLVEAPEAELQRIVEALGYPPRTRVEEAVAANTIDQLRSQTLEDYHFWQGRPGLWRTLLPAPAAESIAAAHEESLNAFGYTCDPDSKLTTAAAEANWRTLELQAALRSAAANREKLAAANSRIAELTQALAQLETTRAAEGDDREAKLSALARLGRLGREHIAPAHRAERMRRRLLRRTAHDDSLGRQ